MTEAILIDEVTKTFPGMERPALDGIKGSIRKGSLTGIVGPDGAGKTTLIRLITGLMIPTKGQISVLGHDTIKEVNDIHAIAGYMPQKFGLYEDLTVLENLELYANLHSLNGQEKVQALAKMLKFTTLKPFVNRLAGKLSGGMKQKLGLACALLSRPKVLLLDEPTVGVDPLSRRELWKMVQDLVAQDITVLWSTSYLDEADRCEEVLLLNEGKLIYKGPPKDLTKRAAGRVFLTPVSQQNKRQILSTLLDKKGIEDGVIQGDLLRLVVEPGYAPEKAWTPTPPRFEDAFIDILGGGPGGTSILAENMYIQEDSDLPPIQAKNLTKKFGDFTAASDISFSIQKGEIFGLLGPNGAGKSTIFKMLCGLLQPTKGKALIFEHELTTQRTEAREHIGYMAQKFSLYSDLSVKENLEFFAGVYGLSGSAKKQEIDLMISLFDLHPYLTSKSGMLPLGFKQRLALACAVMHAPLVLFLDEPTSGVDPITRREFWTHINGMVEKGVTIMVTTHFMDEAEYCDRVALIYQSENIATGTPESLKKLVVTKENPNPTLEDAFIHLIEQTAASQKEKGER